MAVLLLDWEGDDDGKLLSKDSLGSSLPFDQDHGNDLLGAEGICSLASILLLVGLGRLLDHFEWTEFGVIMYSLVRPVATDHPFGINHSVLTGVVNGRVFLMICPNKCFSVLI